MFKKRGLILEITKVFAHHFLKLKIANDFNFDTLYT